MTDQTLVFMNSFSPRTGHNFAAEVLKRFGPMEVAPHPRAESPISTLLAEFDSIRRSKYFESDRAFLDHVLLHGLRERLLDGREQQFVLIKDTTFAGKDLLPEIFPNEIHIVLLRDPEAVVASMIKAMDLSKPGWKSRAKRIATFFGIYPAWIARRLTQRVLALMPDLDEQLILRYEDLVKRDPETLQRLKSLFDSPSCLHDIAREIDDIEVINTSFFEEVGGTKIWEAKKKTSAFDPLRRKSLSWPVRWGIAWGCKPLRTVLGYA